MTKLLTVQARVRAWVEAQEGTFTAHQVRVALNAESATTICSVRSALVKLEEEGRVQGAGNVPVRAHLLRRPERLWARVQR